MGLRGEVITDVAALAALADEWERLRRAGRRPEVFQTFAWCRATWRTLGAGADLATVVVYDGEDLVGALPLALRDGTLRFLGAPGADYNDLLMARTSGPDVLHVALDALLSADDIPWHRCVLEEVPADGNLAAALSDLPQTLRARVVARSAGPCPTLVLGEDRARKVEALAGKASLRRHQRRLERRGEVRFRHLEDRAEIRAHLPAFFRQHVRRRALVGDVSLFLDEAQRSFYEALVEEFDPSDVLRFAVLDLDGRPLAYHFGFQADGKLVWYKPTFDVDDASDGPGEVLLRHLLLYCRDADVRELDFTTGAESFKYRFADLERENLEIVFDRSRVRALATSLRVGTRTAVARRPRVRSAARRVRDTVGASRERATRSLRRGGFRAACRSAARSLRRIVWASDEVRIYSGPPVDASSDAGVDEAGPVVLRRGTMGELADLAVRHPGDVPGAMLRDGGRRLRSGDDLVVATDRDGVVLVAWVGIRDAVRPTAELGPDAEVPLPGPAPVIYDCWTPPHRRGHGVDPRVLRSIARDVPGGATALYAFASPSDHASCRALEDAGFMPWRTLQRRRLLLRFERLRTR